MATCRCSAMAAPRSTACTATQCAITRLKKRKERQYRAQAAAQITAPAAARQTALQGHQAISCCSRKPPMATVAVPCDSQHCTQASSPTIVPTASSMAAPAAARAPSSKVRARRPAAATAAACQVLPAAPSRVPRGGTFGRVLSTPHPAGHLSAAAAAAAAVPRLQLLASTLRWHLSSCSQNNLSQS